jgi:PhzF family phenazine biosynthesis protein
MQSIPIYQVDAFADHLFKGNPAAVCVLDQWLSESVMQNIALENNLAETAFIVRNGKQYDIRWFTPTVEVDLCGHATLASAFVLFRFYHPQESEILFHSRRSGILKVSRKNEVLILDFPADVLNAVDLIKGIADAIGITPVETYKGKTDYLAVLRSEQEVKNLRPNLEKISALHARGLIVTSAGENCDFVSRFFAPQSGVNEDPVTGSAHTTLTVYWTSKTGKKDFTARQLSCRQGELHCQYNGDRILIGGKARLYMSGHIEL